MVYLIWVAEKATAHDGREHSDINSITLLLTVNDVAIPAKKADLAIAIHNSRSVASPTYNTIRKKNPTM